MRVLIILLLAWFMHAVAMADDGGIVVVDRSQTSYWVLYRFPREAAESIKAKIQSEAKIEMVDWSAFKASPETYAGAAIIKDEYPGANLLQGVLALLEKYPKTPFGITWSGGLAFTRSDYAHAERIYQLYRDRPEEYERSKVSSDRSRDPIFPANHLRALLAR